MYTHTHCFRAKFAIEITQYDTQKQSASTLLSHRVNRRTTKKNNTTDIINEKFRVTGTWKSPQVIPVESQNKAQD